MELAQLAVPSVYLLITFLAYTSQWLLLHLDPEPVKRGELIRFNVLLVCLLISYTRSVLVDPGWAVVGKGDGEQEKEIDADGDEKGKGGEEARRSRKWCRKCNAMKPPRAHHCRTCKRCIPKMDHHCPWTANCVSQTTFPHFLRFLIYAVASMSYLFSLLSPRLSHLWSTRHQPSYLGPSMFQLAHLFLLTVINAFVWFALVILLVRNLYALAVNTTTIEGWEIERHETLLRRARVFGGVLEAPDGTSVPIRRQEFPYDVGIWVNVVQGMGTWNPVQWLNPLAGTPVVWRKVTYPTNGFSDRPWPPPDPDRAFYRGVKLKGTGEREGEGFTYRDEGLSNQETVEAFRRRQAEDEVRRRKPFVQRLEEQQRRSQSGTGQQEAWNGYAEDYGYENFDEVEEAARANEKRLVKDGPEGEEGEESWRNAEGERLHDFGVDEDVEFYDEGVEDADDDVPLSELLARKRAAAATAGAR